MKKLLIVSIVIAGMLISAGGCAGRRANPVQTYIPGDENLSCEGLVIEMRQIHKEMNVLRPKRNKLVSNLFWYLVFPPLMDLKDTEKIEYDACARRYNRLSILVMDKDCDLADLPKEMAVSPQRVKRSEEDKRKQRRRHLQQVR